MNVYAVKHKDERIRATSRSGGIFTAISDLFLDGGVVYGCVLDENYNAIHVRTENKTGRDLMRGSKYIQSRLGDCYKQIKNDLEDGRHVLFSGTSCQVAGFRCFLKKDYNNLLCIDIVCHGVPSPKVWKTYLDWISKGKTIINVDFRNKKDFGWRDHVETIFCKNKKINSQVWTYLFYSHNILRPVCYECPYKSIDHPGDITIADYWGIEKACPRLDDNKGVSLVLVNTEKGSLYFEKAKNDIVWYKTRIEDSMQHPLIEPEKVPDERNQFWKDFENKDFSYIARKYGNYTPLWRRTLRKAKHLIKKVLGKD
ncbi:Coenzyme F420 hydrogenase/dehydrogenase, beta subunit C-terminal domain [Anaerobium acetethylicum]|uniref:Coenzyme F420-reducing hydrogenase, beta subunit n=1 Tax=Anaerobium acetethylicum TaxID=1619234 RepID=A0A1D3TRB4_9FIRM|nr:Coenzyme F420 hydrogenase/dehydrogenase, beta subunit C-terminal domain [Anaerobium acetethylicum]SCP96221.1 Coenzyme F420-reducing hydrogenase, beta subunit [Anaerobium acetethylicum]